MEQILTQQDLLEFFAQSDRRFVKRLSKEAAERKKSQKAFDKQMDELIGPWNRFVYKMVEPNILELFYARGIELTSSHSKVTQKKDGQLLYEIDLLLVNTAYVIAVEVKSTLKVADVDEHLDRLEKIRVYPPSRFDLTGASLLGAVVGMITDQDADRYAMKQGLYVLRQAGKMIEIVNDAAFTPKAWNM